MTPMRTRTDRLGSHGTTAARAIAFLAAVLIVVLPGVALGAEDDVVFDGAGFGHGVGMSQYGAYAMANDGATSAEILAHYYPGTTPSTIGVDIPAVPNLLVNLERDVSDITFIARAVDWGDGNPLHAPVTVTRGSDTWTVQTDQRLEIAQGPDGCTLTISDAGGGTITTAPAGPCDLDLTWDGELDKPTTKIEIAGCTLWDWNAGIYRPCQYGRGAAIHLVDNGGGFEVILEIDVDDYTYGISEVSYSWPAAALEAQAVAARGYAAESVYGIDPATRSCRCHVYDTSLSQRYVGWGHGTASWTDAVDATKGVVLTHPEAPNGSIAQTFYSSSNGGATEAVQDKWGGAALPYLASVDDPWSLQPPNPYRSWTKTVPGDQAAAAVGMARLTRVEVTERYTSGSAKTVEFTGSTDAGPAVATRTSSWVASVFGLRSRYFDASIGGTTTPPPDDPPPAQHGSASVGLQDPATGIWTIRRTDGSVDTFYFGNPADIPFIGDWDGDGVETVGLYRTSTGFLFLRNSNTQGVADIDIYYGDPGDLPVAGDWNGDGVDTVGIYRPSTERFYLRNSNTQGVADVVVPFGERGDVPVAGDWDGDGIDTIGVWRPSTRTLYLTNSLTDPTVDIVFDYTGAAAGDRIVVGDWNDDGIDTVGVFRPSSATFYLRDTYTQASANVVIVLGDASQNPIAGFWGQ